MRPRVLLVAGLSLAAVPVATVVLTSQAGSLPVGSSATAGNDAAPEPSLSAQPSPAPGSAGSLPSAAGSPEAPEQQVVPAQRAERVGSVVPEPPQQVRLPREGWIAVDPVGTRRNGQLDVPEVQQLGWWEGSSRIGDPFGVTLLAGHVDDAVEGLGPASALLGVTRGQRIPVRTASRTTTYVVRSLSLLDRADVELHPELFSPRGPARLLMVTCAPPFVPAKGGYQQLAVVDARPVGSPTK